MQFFLPFSLTLLSSFAWASVIRQQIISEFESESCGITPAWEGTNSLNIVPLVSEARTGLVPPEIEEGLIYSLGPRFANVFIKDAKSNTQPQDLKCIIQCAGNLIKEAPCIATAIATENPAALLGCGVDKSDLCSCARCLPDAVQKFVTDICGSNKLPATAVAENTLSYPDWIQFSQRAPYLQGFRGDLKKTVVDEARGLLGNNTSSKKELLGLCPGSSCGGCGCCVGLCLFGSCEGACI